MVVGVGSWESAEGTSGSFLGETMIGRATCPPPATVAIFLVARWPPRPAIPSTARDGCEGEMLFPKQ